MVKTISSALTTLLEKDRTAGFFYRIVLRGNGQSYRLTTSLFDVTYQGFTYSSENGITKMSPLISTNFLDRKLFNLEMFDTSTLKITQLHEFFIGGAVSVNVDFWDSENDQLVEGYNLYTGYIDRTHARTDTERTHVAVLESTGSLSNLDLVKGFVGSKEGRRQLGHTDTSFDNISRNKEEIREYWGMY